MRKALPTIPFPLLGTPALGHVFQFLAGGAAAPETPITRGDLLNLMMVAATATTAYSIIAAIKVKRVRIWSPIVAAFTPVQVQLEWNGGLYAPSAIHSAISEGLTPAKLESSPPPGSSPDLWSITGASNLAEVLFSLSCPTGTVVQVTTALRLMDDEPAPTPVVAVGATIGKTYFGNLDGPPVSGAYVPSGGVAVLP